MRMRLYCIGAMEVWRLAGMVSSVVGLLCHALSPSFERLIGGWDCFKLFLFVVVVFVICGTILFVKDHNYRLLSNHCKLKAHVLFAVLILTSVYSFLCDKAKSQSEKPDMLAMISNGAFALMSLSLSKLLKLGFEVGMFAFFLGSLAVQLMTIKLELILVAIIYGYPLFLLHSSKSEKLRTISVVEVVESAEKVVRRTVGWKSQRTTQNISFRDLQQDKRSDWTSSYSVQAPSLGRGRSVSSRGRGRTQLVEDIVRAIPK